jgi:hypothetical protein
MSTEEDKPYELHFNDIKTAITHVRSQVTDARTRFIRSFAIINGIIETGSTEMSPAQLEMAIQARDRLDFILTVIDEGEA